MGLRLTTIVPGATEVGTASVGAAEPPVAGLVTGTLVGGIATEVSTRRREVSFFTMFKKK
jgi:hypothetical protein